jgi:hypothetical protein
VWGAGNTRPTHRLEIERLLAPVVRGLPWQLVVDGERTRIFAGTLRVARLDAGVVSDPANGSGLDFVGHGHHLRA